MAETPFPDDVEEEESEKGPLGGVPSTDKIGGFKWTKGWGWGDYKVEDARRTPYTEKDVLKPRQWTGEQRADLQARLVATGLLDPNKAVAGVWNTASMTAYRTLLKNANIMGYKASAILDAAAQNPSLVGVDPTKGEDAIEPMTYELPNEDDLRKTFQKAGRDVLGRKLDPTTIDRMVTAYMAQERGRQEDNYETYVGSRMGEQGGVKVEQEDQLGFGVEFVQDEFAPEAEANEFAAQGEEFFDLIRSSRSQ